MSRSRLFLQSWACAHCSESYNVKKRKGTDTNLYYTRDVIGSILFQHSWETSWSTQSNSLGIIAYWKRSLLASHHIGQSSTQRWWLADHQSTHNCPFSECSRAKATDLSSRLPSTHPACLRISVWIQAALTFPSTEHKIHPKSLLCSLASSAWAQQGCNLCRRPNRSHYVWVVVAT